MDTHYPIVTSKEKINRVTQSIHTKLEPPLLQTLYTLYISDTEGMEILMLNYLKLCYRYGLSINLAKNNDTIIAIDTLLRKVRLEVHRFYGFVRFKEIKTNTFYATIEPDHAILPLLSGHFTKRFSNQNFIIHDVRRHTALVYKPQETYFYYLTSEESTQLCNLSFNDPFESLFQTFYTSTTIPERVNLTLQKRRMPLRYWKHLIESPTPNTLS